MVAGKARESATLESLVLKNAAGIELLKALIRDKEGFTSTESRSIGLAGGNTLAGVAGFLETGGDTMIGPLAYFPRLQAIEAEDNSLDISRERGDTFTSRVIVSAVSETLLDYIHGAAHAGQQLELQGVLTESYTIRESLVIAITNIVGDGVTQIITVTVGSTSALATGDYVSIKGTNNFDINLVKITVTGGTTFTYDLGSIGSAVAESVGNVFRGNIRTHLNSDLVVIDNQDYMLTFDSIADEWVVKGAEGGTGGITFPITPPVDARGNVSTTQDIDLSATTAHVTTMTLTGDIAITLSNIPPNLTQIEWEIEIKQDGVGGHDVTSWPTGTTPIPVLDSTAGNTTIVVLRVNDGGTIIRSLTSTSGGAASLWANFTAVNNVNVGNFVILAVKNMDFDDPNSFIQGIKEIRFFDDDPNKFIKSTPDTLEIRIPVAEQLDLFVENVLKYSIEQPATGQPVLHEFLGGSIEDVGEIIFDLSSDAIIAATEPGIGYDNTLDQMVFNVPSGGDFRFFEANVLKIEYVSNNFQFGTGVKLITNPDNTRSGLNVGANATDPTVPADADIVYNSTTNKFRFRENGAWVEIGAGSGANTALSNLIATSINQSLIPGTTNLRDLGSATFKWRNLWVDATAFFDIVQLAVGVSTNWFPSTDNTRDLGTASLEWRNLFIDGIANIDTLAATTMSGDLTMAGNDILTVGEITSTSGNVDVGDSTTGFDAFFGRRIEFPNVLGARTSSLREIVSTTISAINTIVMNLPLNEDFMITENGITSPPALLIDTSAGFFQLDNPLLSIRINLSDPLTITKNDGLAAQLASNDGFEFSGGDVDIDDNDLTSVNNLFITTAAGAAVASIRGFDAATDILEIRLGGAVDFVITDNGTVRAEFDNTLLTWKFGGSSLLQLPQETQISDRTSALSTPPSGFMSLYVINAAGVQTFKVKFDNGTEKTIATDV